MEKNIVSGSGRFILSLEQTVIVEENIVSGRGRAIHIVTGIDCHSGREYCQWKGTIHNNIVIGITCYSGGDQWWYVCRCSGACKMKENIVTATQCKRTWLLQEAHTDAHAADNPVLCRPWHSSLDYRNIKNSNQHAHKKHQTSAVSLAESGE